MGKNDSKRVVLDAIFHYLYVMLGLRYSSKINIFDGVFPKSLKPSHEDFFKYPVSESLSFKIKYSSLKKSCAFEFVVITDLGAENVQYFITAKESCEIMFFEFYFGEKLQKSNKETKEYVAGILNERMKRFMGVFMLLNETHNKEYLLFHMETKIVYSSDECLAFFLNSYFKRKV
jgi:hypothetical protein